MTVFFAQKKKRRRNFKALCYTARGIATSVRGVGFSPDFGLIKDRVNSNVCVMSGGVLNTYSPPPYSSYASGGIYTSSDPAEVVGDSAAPLASFDSPDGFTTSNYDSVVKTAVTSENFASWWWRRDPDFFNIVNYTANNAPSQAIPHGLTSAPKMIFAVAFQPPFVNKGIFVYHAHNTGAPETDYLKFNTAAATADLNTIWNDTAPDSTNFTVGSELNTSANGFHMAMCWAEQAGESKFGSYTGNGNPVGPIISGLGFNPSMVMIKRTDTGASHWTIFDTNRRGPDPVTEHYYLALEDTAPEFSGVGVLLGNDKFQPVSDNANTNANGGTYIYAAFR